MIKSHIDFCKKIWVSMGLSQAIAGWYWKIGDLQFQMKK
jgi:hypothetical protein